MSSVAPSPTSMFSLEACRAAQRSWATVPLRERLAMIRRFRHSLASTAAEVSLLVAAVRSTSPREALTSEVIPLFSACKFLERNAVRSLGRRKQAGTAPMWLRGVEVEIEREPFGVVLVIAPGNFPLFLAGVQVLQALVAGNAVLWKPAPGTTEVVERMDSLLITAGFPPGLVQVLSEENEGVETAIDAGVDKVFVTGSLNTGREVQKLVAASERPIPIVAELSGCDLCVLLASADIRRASKALVFGVALNAGRTCIAPRTSLVHRSIFERATSQLTQAFDAMAALHVPDTRDTIRARRWIADALQRGAVALGAHDPLSQWPVLLTGVPRRHPLRTEDVFAPVLCVDAFEQLDDVLAVASDSEFALGMSIFGEESEARALAAQANVGCVCINDVIAPTADPRVPFSGRKASGYGVTRGAEGLLEMTQVKSIVTQRSQSPLHLRPARQNDFSLLLAWTGLAHSRAQDRWTHLKQLLQSLRGHHD